MFINLHKGHLLSGKQKTKKDMVIYLRQAMGQPEKAFTTKVKLYLNIETQIDFHKAQAGKRRKSTSGGRHNVVKDSTI